MVIDYVPKEEARRVLSTYLSEITVTDEDAGSELRLPEMSKPEGFHLIHKRCSRRSLYEISEAFAIILSGESTWRSDGTTEEFRESVSTTFNKIIIMGIEIGFSTQTASFITKTGDRKRLCKICIEEKVTSQETLRCIILFFTLSS